MTTEILKRSLFAQGQRLFKAGDPPVCAYLIQSGQVDIVIERDGQEVCVSTLEAGDMVGEMALIDEQPRVATAVAKHAATCVVLTAIEFQRRLERSDPFVRAMLKVITKRLRKSDTTLRSSSLPPPSAKQTAAVAHGAR